MQLEIQMALNFVISYMYNKLPRRRVNIFGEELEKALKVKFQGHWYPNQPMKGSAYRCIKTGDPIDPVLEIAARQSGLELSEVIENLPNDLSVWVDPREVSYRIGEKMKIKILYSEHAEVLNHEETLDKEVTKTFNPEAQCFKPIEDLSSSLSSISLSSKSSSPYSSNSPTPPFKTREASPVFGQKQVLPHQELTAALFAPKSTAPLTFTIATFAQTKFGSTKLKSNAKRTNRMSPTEFSQYIKQRQLMQQQQNFNFQHQAPPTQPQPRLAQQQSAIQSAPPTNFGNLFTPAPARPQSLSPNPLENMFFQNNSNSANQVYNPWGRGMFDQNTLSSQSFFNDILPPASQHGQKFPMCDAMGSNLLNNALPTGQQSSVGDKQPAMNDGLANMYPQSQYQHLLVAN